MLTFETQESAFVTAMTRKGKMAVQSAGPGITPRSVLLLPLLTLCFGTNLFPSLRARLPVSKMVGTMLSHCNYEE